MREFVARNTLMLEQSSRVFAPVTYPWGFPLLLAPVYALFGPRVLALKFVSTVCYALFVLVFFLLARTRLRDREALVVTAVLGFNPALLQAQNGILADIPFLLFSTLGLWLIEKFVGQEARGPVRIGPAIAIGCAIFLAVFMRGNGFLLLLALMTAQCMQLFRRSGERRGLHLTDLWALMPYAVLALLDLLQTRVFPSVAYPLREQFAELSLTSVWRNLWFYFWLPSDMFNGLLQGGSLLYLILLIAFLVDLSRRRPRDFPIHVYGLATLILFVLYPPIQDLRYIFPLLPLFVLFSFRGMQSIAGRLKPSHRQRGTTFVSDLWAGLAIFSLAACVQLAWINMTANRYVHARSSGAFSAGTNEMFEYIREKTPADSMIIFFKPRAMRLRTDRDSFSTTNCQDLTKADYVATLKSNIGWDQISSEDVGHCNPAVLVTRVYEKDDFIVSRIDPAP